LNRRPLLRLLAASAVIASALTLGGCDTDTLGIPEGRALAPLSDKMLAEIEAKNMSKESPILVRLYKEESELEVWKQDNTGHFELLKSYPICRWSGELGPKIKEGDRQAPEGFYPITPGQMNPNSNYYLAINTGFPNVYDRANGHTGAFLMIHGDCSSSGCYAMTDEQIAEIYALARESIFGGQKAFQIQAYPFHMTPANMAKHRNSPNMAFWRMIKEGNDHFEITHLEPKVDVCERHYVFDAQGLDGKPLHFDPTGKCPAYKVSDDLMASVKDKQQRDEAQFAELVGRGTETVPARTGMDGGMNPVFMAAVAQHGGTDQRIQSANGSIPANIRPPGPRDDLATGSTMSLASAESRPVAAPSSSSGSSGNLFSNLFSSKGESASASSDNGSSGGGMFDRVSRMMGLHGSDQPAAEAPASTKSKPAAAKPTQTASAGAPKPKSTASKSDPASDSKSAATPTPTQPANQQANAAAPTNNGSVLNGAASPVPAGSFDSRWGGMH
jgi:murein L,D-transpeptidase YafK